MIILLQHFPEIKTILKKFDTLSDVEIYMNSKKIIPNIDGYDLYSGKSWEQVQLAESPVYIHVFDFIYNSYSRAIIYDINEDFNYIHIKFDNESHCAPYISSITNDYNGELLYPENIINTNDDEYDKTYTVKL
jgi:hypothetical protein